MTLQRTKDGWSVQLRFGKGRRARLAMPRLDQDPQRDRQKAEWRRDILAALTGELAQKPHLDAEKMLRLAASMPSDKTFAGAVRAAKDAMAGAVPVGPVEKKLATFRDVAEEWLSGRVHRRFPDDVKPKSVYSVEQSRGVVSAICRTQVRGRPFGDLPLDEITREDALEVKSKATPEGVTQATRAHYARHIRIVLGFAVAPLRLIDISPVPPKFVPPYGHKRALGFLYPEEDAILLGAPDEVVPYQYRLYYGFLARNGCRPAEGMRLTFGDLDLRQGVITLDKTKTKTPRAWKMADDVQRVLVGERERRQAGDEDLVFPGVDRSNLARRFREHLWDAGVQRRELHRSSAERRPLRVHDLRGSFVTIALSVGANEDWVMRRTGHTTSAMLAKYRRQISHAQELDLGWYRELDKCLSGEIAASIQGVAHGVARKVKIPVNLPGLAISSWTYVDASSSTTEPKTPDSENASAGTPWANPAKPGRVARAHQGVARTEAPSAPPADRAPEASAGVDTPVEMVEKALAFALEAATRDGRYDVVLAVTAELRERRLQRTAPQVTSLEQARAKREKGEGK